jgi:hypothetical protein
MVTLWHIFVNTSRTSWLTWAMSVESCEQSQPSKRGFSLVYRYGESFYTLRSGAQGCEALGGLHAKQQDRALWGEGEKMKL